MARVFWQKCPIDIGIWFGRKLKDSVQADKEMKCDAVNVGHSEVTNDLQTL